MSAAVHEIAADIHNDPDRFIDERDRRRLRWFTARMFSGYTTSAYIADVLIPALEWAVTTPNARLIVTMPPRHSKALALDTPIPTPSGWTTMGEIKVGDQVFDERGIPCNVTWVSPVWKDRPVYAVTTDDHDVIVADENHEWPVSLCRKRRHAVKLKTSRQLAERTSDRRPMIAIHGALEMPEADLPVDPYVLGVWLGDGHSNSGALTQGIEDAPFIREEIRRAGYETSDRTDPTLFTILGLRGDLVRAGVLNNKHIPGAYLRASRQQRLALLQGLVDTDGSAPPSGQIVITQINQRLSDGILELVRSLGVKASQYQIETKIDGRECGPAWMVSFYMADAARLPRKRKNCRAATRQRDHYIGVAPIGTADTVCITVDSPSHLFLAGRSMIPTHNSLHVSEHLPAWFLGNHPDKRIIAASHTASLAYTFSRRVRNKLNDPRWPFPSVRVADDKGAVQAWDIDGHTGGYIAVGVGGSPTGHGGHLIVIDDPLRSAADADSETVRESLWEWYRETMRTRLEPGGSIILTATRWHMDDLTGRLLREADHGGEQWQHVHMPALSEDGDALWPERWPVEALTSIRQSVGTRAWEAQFQGRPAPMEGGILKRHWFGVYGLPENHYYAIIQAWDTAFKTSAAADYTACVTIGVGGYGIDILDVFRARLEFPDLERALQDQHLAWSAKHPGTPISVLVEDKGSGQSLIQAVKRWPHRNINIIPVSASRANEKMQRVNEVTPVIESGRVRLPAQAHWLDDAVNEWTSFPFAAHDDMTDALTMAVARAAGIGQASSTASDTSAFAPADTIPPSRRFRR